MKRLLLISTLLFSLNSNALISGEELGGESLGLTKSEQISLTTTTAPLTLPTVLVQDLAEGMSEEEMMEQIKIEMTSENDEIALFFAEVLAERIDADPIDLIAQAIE